MPILLGALGVQIWMLTSDPADRIIAGGAFIGIAVALFGAMLVFFVCYYPVSTCVEVTGSG